MPQKVCGTHLAREQSVLREIFQRESMLIIHFVLLWEDRKGTRSLIFMFLFLSNAQFMIFVKYDTLLPDVLGCMRVWIVLILPDLSHLHGLPRLHLETHESRTAD